VYKTALKETPPAEGMSLTFRPSQRARGQIVPNSPVTAVRRPTEALLAGTGLRRTGCHGSAVSLDGTLIALREFTLMYAHNINSYKRYQPARSRQTAVE